jgi:hypothetical protein
VPHPDSVREAMRTLMPMILGMDAVIGEFDENEQDTITTYLERVADVYRAQLPAEGAGTTAV